MHGRERARIGWHHHYAPDQVGTFLAHLCLPQSAILTGANVEIMSNVCN